MLTVKGVQDLVPDGTWHEGTGYFTTGMRTLLYHLGKIRSVAGSRQVTNGWQGSHGMRRTTTALRTGILEGRSRQLRVWYRHTSSQERCSMLAAGPARTLFT